MKNPFSRLFSSNDSLETTIPEEFDCPLPPTPLTKKQLRNVRTASWSLYKTWSVDTVSKTSPGYHQLFTATLQDQTVFLGETTQGVFHIGRVAHRDIDRTLINTPETLATFLQNPSNKIHVDNTDWTNSDDPFLATELATHRTNLIEEHAAIPPSQRQDPQFFTQTRAVSLQHLETLKIQMIQHMADIDTRNLVLNGTLPKRFDVLNWIAQSPTLDTRHTPSPAHPRRDVVNQTPWLATLAGMNSAKDPKCPITEAIDKGYSPIDITCETFAITPQLAKHVRKLPLSAFDAITIHDMHTVFSDLKEFPNATHIERTHKGIQHARVLAQANAHYKKHTGNHDGLHQIGPHHEQAVANLMDQPAQEVGVFFDYLKAKLAIPIATHAARKKHKKWDMEACLFEATHPDAPPLFTEMTFLQSLKSTGLLHKHRARLDAAINTLDPPKTWTPLLGTLDTPNGLTLVELHSTQALKKEGKEQDHCVGDFTAKIIEGTSLVYSIRSQDSVMSTVEINSEKGLQGGAFQRIQHYGTSNTAPPQETLIAEQHLLSHLNQTSQQERNRYAAALEPLREHSKQHNLVDYIKYTVAKYDFGDVKNIDDTLAHLNVIFPSRALRLTADAWIAKATHNAPAKTTQKIKKEKPENR